MGPTTAAEEQPLHIKASFWANLYLLLMLVATLASGIRVLRSTGVWTLADWLINYSGGFVRRGLPGTIALWLQKLLHVRAAVIVVCSAMLLYIIVFVCLYLLIRGVRWTFWGVAAFVSPVGVAYPFVSTSGYHKEVFFFATFAVLVCRLLRLRQLREHLSWRESLYLTAAGIIGVLTHELFAIYFAYIIAALFISDTDWRRVLRVVVLPAAALFLTLAAVVSHPGTPALAKTVCESLGSENHVVCSGSIAYLGHTRQEAKADTMASVEEYHYMAFMPPLTLLGLLPLAAGFHQLLAGGMPRRAWMITLSAITFSLASSVLLFLYGADWGRWIEIHLFSLFLLLLFLTALYRPNGGNPRQRLALSVKLLRTALLLIYATCWSLPGTTNIPKGGYVSMFSRVGSRVMQK